MRHGTQWQGLPTANTNEATANTGHKRRGVSERNSTGHGVRDEQHRRCIRQPRPALAPSEPIQSNDAIILQPQHRPVILWPHRPLAHRHCTRMQNHPGMPGCKVAGLGYAQSQRRCQLVGLSDTCTKQAPQPLQGWTEERMCMQAPRAGSLGRSLRAMLWGSSRSCTFRGGRMVAATSARWMASGECARAMRVCR